MLRDYSDIVVYADESGDHNLERINPDFPLFVLTLCIFSKADYVSSVVPRMQAFKFRWFGHDMVVLHEREIRQHAGPFGFLENSRSRALFLDELTDLIDEAPFSIVAAVIDKRRMTHRFEDPTNPYDLALRACLERLHALLIQRDQADRPTFCVFERRGRKEDADLELSFRRITDGDNVRAEAMPELRAVFADKKANSTGLQIADLTARPIGLTMLRPGQPNRAFDVIARKIAPRGLALDRRQGIETVP